MLEFLLYVRPILPPLTMPLRPSSVPPLLVYTDAMFTPRVPHPLLRIGWFVFDPITRAARHSHLELLPAYFTIFNPGQKTYICQGEGVGAVAPALSVPHLFRGRHVVQFNDDNSGALSSLINGYASKPDMCRIVNVYHLTQSFLQATVWLEWVPSAANMPAALGELLAESLGHSRLGAIPMGQGSLMTARPFGLRPHRLHALATTPLLCLAPATIDTATQTCGIAPAARGAASQDLA